MTGRIADSVTDLIGATPMAALHRFSAAHGLTAPVLAKLEYFNPAGSAKDRVAAYILEQARRRGQLRPSTVVVEPTSGNTGIGLAAVAAAQGYRVILTMPETMSPERRKLLAAYGAQLVLTPGEAGMQGAVDKANELIASLPDALLAGQFTNPDNPAAHFETTGPEIWQATGGAVDIFVAGVGTGGTVTGVGRYLRQQKPDVQIIGVEPAESPLLSQGKAGAHGIQGIGANFVPQVFDRTVTDEILPITTGQSLDMARQLARTEGYLVGISSGAALCAAVQVAARPENAGKTVVALLPDTGERYLSTALFDEA